MPELKKRTLGTDRSVAPVKWVVQQMGSFLVGEIFNSGYYQECLKMAESMAVHHRPMLTAIQASRQSSTVDLERMIAQLEDVSRWARDEGLDGYHTVNTHVFITLWAALEAGIENIIAEIIRTNKEAAEIASGKFVVGKYPADTWPWEEALCIEIAQKLDSKAKDKTVNGGKDIAQRMVTLFSWFNMDIVLMPDQAGKYNEASFVRNIIMHRYGYISPENAKDFPELAPWIGGVLPITSERLLCYHNAVNAMYLSIMKAVFAGEYK